MLWLLRRILLLHSDMLTRCLHIPPSPLALLPLPAPRETHFWYVVPDEVKDDSLLSRYVEILSPCERQSILQMNKDKVQKGALLARTLVRTTLARCMSQSLDTNGKTSPSSLKFRKNKFGKPEIEWNHDKWTFPSLRFNISHTSSLIACGVTTEVPIGIDVEEKQRKTRNNILSLARRYFSPSEVEFLHSLSDPERQRGELLKLWTLKEAYVKALGRGFSAAPFRDFTIRFEASERKQFPKHSETPPRIVVEVSDTSESLTSNWQFALFELEGSHFAAVCVESDNSTRGCESNPLKLKVWKTLPLVEDECILEKNAVVNISGLS